ncbi:hypothetical protein HYZ78_04555 [Candidatus Microgenomates bacterium]|nr:hypothetical protein [Candidatus Microgenomates bacterium]
MAKAQNDLVTKKYLGQQLSLTKKYLDGRLNLTKKYLDQRLNLIRDYINERFDEFGEKVNERFDEFGKEMREKMDKRFDENKRDLLSIKDEIITEVKKNRDNQEMHDVSHERINRDLNDHEERIEALETSSKRN